MRKSLDLTHLGYPAAHRARSGRRGITADRFGVMKIPINSATYQALFTAANVTDGTVPEAIPWIYYDTQNMASSWSTTSYFAATNSDTSACNIEQPQTIAGEQYFMLYAITFDFLMGSSIITPDTGSSPAGQIDDARTIFEIAHAALQVFLSQKLILRIPLMACHSIGGYEWFVAGTPSSSGLWNTVQNMKSDGAFWCDGAFIFPPKQTFQFQAYTGATATQVATRSTRLSIHGVLYRPVR
jgi:hypothetical protein